MTTTLRTIAFAASIVGVGCGLIGIDPDDPPPDEMPPDGLQEIGIAVGATVTLIVSPSGCSDDPLHICAEPGADSLQAALSSTSSFELGPMTTDGFEAQLQVTALSVGTTILSLDGVRDGPSEVRLRAEEIDRPIVVDPCRNPANDRTHAYTPGSSFPFGLQALAADGTLLAVGDLPLVTDYGGFVIVDHQATIPDTLGVHSWTFTTGHTADFVVYDPLDLALELAMKGGKLIGKRSVAGVPVCVHDAISAATLDITGPCNFFCDGMVIDGSLPVNLGNGDVEVAVVGNGTCGVTTTLPSGTATLQATVSSPPPGIQPAPAGWTAMTTTRQLVYGVTTGGMMPATCAGSVTDGVCDFPDDLDCITDSDWSEALFLRKGTEIAPDALVGVGTPVVLHLRVVGKTLIDDFDVGPPQNFSFTVSPATGLDVSVDGCAVDTGHNALALTLTPQQPGDYTIDYTASNIDDEGSFTLRARSVTNTIIRIGGGTVTDAYIGTTLGFSVLHQSSEGGEVYVSDAIYISTGNPESGAAFSRDRIYTGTSASTIVLSSQVGGSYDLRVHDETIINGIIRFPATSLALGRSACVDPDVSTAIGGIRGDPPVSPRLTFPASSTVAWDPTAIGIGICLQGVAPGQSRLELGWAAAQSSATWTVREPVFP